MTQPEMTPEEMQKRDTEAVAECRFLTDTLYRLSTGRSLGVLIGAHMTLIQGIAANLDQENKEFIVENLKRLTEVILESPDISQETTIQ